MATDLDSRNGTALNGEPLDRPRRLRDGDTLIVGGHRLEVSDPVPAAGRARTVAAAEPSVALNEEERATAAGARRALPQRGRLRRPSRHPRRDRREPSTSASAPPSAASTPSPPSSTSPATPAATAPA